MPDLDLQVTVGNYTIKKNDMGKFLVLIIDKNLRWDLHNDGLCLKLSKGICFETA